jgi:hypothetical protein
MSGAVPTDRNIDRDIDHCDDCGVDFCVISPAPMLRDEVWAAIGQPTERLCADCMFRRAKERGVRLTLASLKPLPVNLRCNPWSWFDLFLERVHHGELPPDFDMQAWRKAAEVFPPSVLPSFFK